MSLDKKVILKRLTFIKHLYNRASEDANLGDPINNGSIITFYDVVEFFLELSAQYLGVKVTRQQSESILDAYLRILNPKLQSLGKSSLGFKSFIVNQLRVARSSLKHGLHLISSSEVEKYRTSTLLFLEENTKNVFDVEFSEISLANMIVNDEVKREILLAEQELGKNELEESLKHSAIAFEIMMHDLFEKDRYDKKKVVIGQSSAFRSRVKWDPMPIDYDPWREETASLRMHLRVLGLGIDYLKYAKFKLIIPHTFFSDAKWTVNTFDRLETKENCIFCIQFVVESAIQVQRVNKQLSP